MGRDRAKIEIGIHPICGGNLPHDLDCDAQRIRTVNDSATILLIEDREEDVTELYNTGYTPPATNYGIEIWFLPQNKGIVSDNTQDPVAWLFSSGGSVFGLGPGGGAVVRVKDNGDGTSSLQAGVVQQGNSVNVVDFGR
jgi:hypothetical protein